MYSATINGEVLDYNFKPMQLNNYGYHFYVGNIFMGYIFKMKRSWSAVASKVPCVYGSVNGFKSRLDAAEFILQVYRNKKGE